MSAEFILVSGANGTGKTMLIESNRPLLEKRRFQIIIPDNILRHATSLTDSPALIQDHIDNAISSAGNKAVLVKFYSTQSPYLRNLFEQSTLQRKMGNEVFKIVKSNQDYPTSDYRRRKSGPRLKF
jgi:predicted ATP-binding protein involved in virulence